MFAELARDFGFRSRRHAIRQDCRLELIGAGGQWFAGMDECPARIAVDVLAGPPQQIFRMLFKEFAQLLSNDAAFAGGAITVDDAQGTARRRATIVLVDEGGKRFVRFQAMKIDFIVRVLRSHCRT